MSSLKDKTVSGLIWSFIDNLSRLGLTFIIGIILARLLSPREFGLIGMITVFIALSQSLVDSGFTKTLIRKKDCNQADYSTVFYFNLFVGIILYAVMFFLAGAISRFFNLDTKNYENIIDRKRFGLADAEPSVQLVNDIRNAELSLLKVDYCTLVKYPQMKHPFSNNLPKF